LSRKEKRTSIRLLKIKQEKLESLADFARRFDQEAVLILDLEDGITYASFLNGFRNGWFTFSLAEQRR